MSGSGTRGYLPTLGQALAVLAAGIVFAVAGPTWLYTFWRIGTALWLCTYLYTAVRAVPRGHDREKTDR